MPPVACTSPSPAACLPDTCRQRCALEVIDELLATRRAVSGDEADHLLDLRWKLRQADDAEGTLRLFCDLRLRMERRHYLAFFRLRRWLEHHLQAAVRICPAAEAQIVHVKLDHYCVEAIRRVCLCAGLARAGVMLAPRLEFRFTAPPGAPVAPIAAASAGVHGSLQPA